MTAGSQTPAEVKIQRSIFQRDSLSLILYVITRKEKRVHSQTSGNKGGKKEKKRVLQKNEKATQNQKLCSKKSHKRDKQEVPVVLCLSS